MEKANVKNMDASVIQRARQLKWVSQKKTDLN